jgi:sugar/nucleoside kinase (ribokinase family)
MAGLVIGLTRGVASQTVLECACGLGAYVASQAGATPLLPGEMIAEIASKFRL